MFQNISVHFCDWEIISFAYAWRPTAQNLSLIIFSSTDSIPLIRFPTHSVSHTTEPFYEGQHAMFSYFIR